MSYWLPVTRFIHLAASILMAALFVFNAVVLFPVVSCNKAHRGSEFAAGRLFWLCFSLTFLSGFVWFLIVSTNVSGAASPFEVDPQTYWLVLTQTRFGHVWLFRLLCGLILAALFLVRSPDLIKALFAVVIVASLGGISHAAAGSTSPRGVALAGDVGHLVAASFWPGGLLPFLLYITAETRRTLPRSWIVVARVCQRFSTVSLLSVLFLAATGVSNAFFIVGDLHSLFATAYGRLLSLKIAVFALMLGFGACNLLVLKPRLLAFEDLGGQTSPPAPVLWLARSVLCETVLGAGILLIVGYLGAMPPPMH
jgi:copper resistance protein D